MYEEHLTAHALETRCSALYRLKLLVTLFALAFITSFAIAMVANGFFVKTAIS